jgi:ADP-ribosylglycohydrolase
VAELRERLRGAWEGRVSGCQLGKPVELLVHFEGQAGLDAYLESAGALPLRDYVPLVEDTLVARIGRASCRGELCRSEPDDDINYTVLALLVLEDHGLELGTEDVGRAWLRLLPVGATFTAERAAYKIMLDKGHEHFALGAPAGFDLAACSDHEWNEWIGAQIRADLYGWVCPGRPELAADLARRDAALSHRGEGIHGAVFVASAGAAIAGSAGLAEAVECGLAEIPADSGAAAAVALGREWAGRSEGGAAIREQYAELPVVHTLNNLALVVWALLSHPDDFGAAIGDAVAAGLDTDCNGATVGGLWGLQGKPVPEAWTDPWRERIAVNLAGVGELRLGELVERTAKVAEQIAKQR